MTQQHDGGPAFPRPASEFTKNGTLPDGNDAIAEQSGMSLRDWFAGQAPSLNRVAGTLTKMAELSGIALPDSRQRTESQMAPLWAAWTARAEAAWRYRYADAMLAARKRKADA